jgi:thiol-disulfide isomerase/thioredoxin
MFPTHFSSVAQFKEQLNYYLNAASYRSLIIQWTATWCGPCQLIKPHVVKLQESLPPDVLFVVLDIEQNMELYSFFRTKKMITGVPCFFHFESPVSSLIPQNVLLGSDISQIKLFFGNAA